MPVSGHTPDKASESSMRQKEDFIVFSIKALAVATAVTAGVVLAMPATSQAMPQAAPVKIDAAKNSNLTQVYYRYCRYHRCYYRHHYVRRYYRHYGYYPYRYRYYGYYPYHYRYYGYYPYYGPGLHIWPFGIGIY
jgi:hypothetical protein